MTCSKCGGSDVEIDQDQDHPGVGVCKQCGPTYIVDEVKRLKWHNRYMDEMTREELLTRVIPSLMRALETQRQSIAREREMGSVFRRARLFREQWEREINSGKGG